MSETEAAADLDNYEFKWGKKKSIGGKKKEVQFYESFTFDGIEYFLYDCVYLYKEGEPEPYIGKLVKIWEQPGNKRRVKVLWFFRPVEILNWLDDVVVLENEIFLASGEGVGLANVNPLEVIAGRCNVVCTSKDKRNPQPSKEELKEADYFFYRTFDVSHCTISEKIDDKIAGIEVRFIFKREDGQNSGNIPKLEGNRRDDENGKVVANDKLDPSIASGREANLGDNTGDGIKQVHASDKKSISSTKVGPNKDVVEDGKIPISRVEDKEKSKQDLGPVENRLSKKAKLDSLAKSPEDLQTDIPPLFEEGKIGNHVPKKLMVYSDEDDMKASRKTSTAFEDQMKSKLVKNPLEQDKASLKKIKHDEKITKLSNGSSPKVTGLHAPENDRVMEVTRRPEADRSKWFKGLPWEERVQTANEQGTLVLLDNLDPVYTSTEIEDIIWHGFRESCTAKIVQQTAFSSPHSGKALVVFKTREAAEMAIRKLDEGCLMLPNGRPLVGSRGTPARLSGKPSTFVGHLSIDKVQFQLREWKQAKSTSHYSQPNTVEYDMAMEWRLLQEKSDIWWRSLYEKQRGELRKLKADLKLK